MDLSELLATYLSDSRQIDPLARRQADCICRCLDDPGRRSEANAVVLLALAALQKGTPRFDRDYLMAPLSGECIAAHADTYRLIHGHEPAWLDPLNASVGTVSGIITILFKQPDYFIPLTKIQSPDRADEWPILVVEGGFAGFSRYWSSVKRLETYHVPARLNTPSDDVATATVKEALRQVFITHTMLKEKQQFHCRQIAAAALACRTRFMVLSGGPGTGKTSVVLQILRTLLRVYPHICADRIMLCASTGRAKARLGESIDAGLDDLLTRFPETAAGIDGTLRTLHRKTLHSLLGQLPDGSFRYNRKNRLSAQVIVVDEASMVDLTLFAALMDACSDDCRLLLVGDMHQLPSVEAGAVLGDLTAVFSAHETSASLLPETGAWIEKVVEGISAEGKADRLQAVLYSPRWIEKAGPLSDHVVILTHSYRSSQTILDFAGQVNRGAVAAALEHAASNGKEQPVMLSTTPGIHGVETWLHDHLCEKTVSDAYSVINDREGDIFLFSTELAVAIETVLFSATVLTLVHEGPRGRKAINRLAGNVLRTRTGLVSDELFFHGMPVILSANHRHLDLYNGDIGLVVQSINGGKKVCFPRGNRFLVVSIERLIDLEPAFALTVHKAQGSEFDEVLLVLPEKNSPLLTRQMIYTGITRARNRVEIIGSEEVFTKAIQNREDRRGGLIIGDC